MNSVIELHILVDAGKKNNYQINLMILTYAKVIITSCFSLINVLISMILYVKS